MSSRSSRWLVVVAVLLLGSGLCAQQAAGRKFDPWGEATVAAAFEHDLAKAAKIYQDIAGNPKETAEMQTKALLELGKVLRKAGMVAEAKAALQQASEGRGVAATEAAKILSAGTQDPDLLQVKVEKLITRLRKVPLGFHDLLWIGEPAAPYLVAAVDKEKADLEFIAGASGVLFRMGGKVAEEWAKNAVNYPDVLKRRAVLKSLQPISVSSPSALKVSATTLQGFLEDKEPSVRRDAVNYLFRLVPADRIIAMLKDSSPVVVGEVRMAVERRWNGLKHGGSRNENLVKVIGIYESAGWPLNYELASPAFEGTRRGRLLFLRVLRRDAVKNRKVTVYVAATPLTKDELKEIMVTADALGPAIGATRTSKPLGWRAKQSLASFVGKTLEAWDHDAMPAALKLVSLNYGSSFKIDFENWLMKHATTSDIPAISKMLRWMIRPDRVLYWMARQKVPNSVLKDLQAFALWLDGLDWENSQDIPIRHSKLTYTRRAVCRAIAAMRTSEAEKYLVSLIRREPGADQSSQEQKAWGDWKEGALSALKESDDNQTMRTLAELLVTPGDSKHARHVRYGALQTLAALQADTAIDRYAKAYQLGFERPSKGRETIVTFENQRLRVYGGLRLIVESRGAAPEVRKGREPYSDETLAKIFDSCLATGKLAAFQDATYCMMYMSLPHDVVTAIANRALQCPDNKTDARGNTRTLRQTLVWRLVHRYPSARGIVPLIQRALRDDDSELRRLVLGTTKRDHVKDRVVLELVKGCLRDENEIIVQIATDLLSHTHPQSIIAVKDYLLNYKNAYVQSDVAMVLLQARGADAIPTVGKLLLPGTQLDYGHRKALLVKMAEFRDMKAVPFLLEALKDEDGRVRKAAEQELKSIRFYNEQKQLWTRLMNGTDMSASSAAEALVKQAGRGNKKDIRLTAIQSLGTLGKAETLPFLVKLMGDVDPDIRKAAKAAADRINAKTKVEERK